MIDKHVFEELIITTGQKQAKKITEMVEKHAEENGISRSAEHKNLRQYILIYERKERLLEMILKYNQIASHTRFNHEMLEYYMKEIRKFEEELLNLDESLESLDLPLLLE